MYSQLQIIEAKLDEAVTFSDVFGKDPTPDSIKSQFAKLVKLVHPDIVPDRMKTDADRIFGKLCVCRDDALKALGDGEYNRGRKKFELISRKGTYTLEEEPFALGENSIIYRGTVIGSTILAKVAREPRNNPFLEAEAKLLSKSNILPSFVFVPRIEDSFYIEQEGKRYRVNVMSLLNKFVTLKSIHNTYPEGIDPRDAAWIQRRVFGMSLAARSLGLTHTAITLDHVLVNPTSHDPLYLGWGHAIQRGKFEPEQTDTTMAAGVFVALVRDVPIELQPLMDRCLSANPKHIPSIRCAMDEFTLIIRKLWGREYRPFNMKGA